MLVKNFQPYLLLCFIFLFFEDRPRRLSSEPGFTKSPLFLPPNKFPAIVKLECKLFLPSLSLHASFFSCQHLASMQAFFLPTFSLNTSFSAYPACFFQQYCIVQYSVMKPNVWTYNSLRFLGTILRVLRLEVSVYNVYIANQFQTPFAQGGGG
jgi:hypothetical protein